MWYRTYFRGVAKGLARVVPILRVLQKDLRRRMWYRTYFKGVAKGLARVVPILRVLQKDWRMLYLF